MPETPQTITLRDITADNWRAVAFLELAEAQKEWVAPPWYTILQAGYEGGVLKAIYADDVVVGQVWYQLEEHTRSAHINRLLTGLAHQGKGYGRAAMHLVLADCESLPFVDVVYISFVPGNDIARKLYLDLGFVDTGEMDDGEHVFKRPIVRVNTPQAAWIIRQAQPNEADLLTDVTLRSKAYWGYDADFMKNVTPILTIHAETIATSEYWVLETDGVVQGYYSLEAPIEDSITLENLFIVPEAIGKGYGKTLLRHALQTAVERGFKVVTLDSDPNAEGFYLKLGAERVGERPSNIMANRILPLMRFDLHAGLPEQATL